MAAISVLSRRIGELVDAFLADDRRIHVGDQQLAESRPVRLNHDIDFGKRFEHPPSGLKIARETQVGGVSFVDPVGELRARIELAEQPERPLHQPVIEPSGCYQRRCPLVPLL